MLILQSGGHFDLLTAALSESGLSGLADEFAAEESTDSAGLSNHVCLKLVKVKQLIVIIKHHQALCCVVVCSIMTYNSRSNTGRIIIAVYVILIVTTYTSIL